MDDAVDLGTLDIGSSGLTLSAWIRIDDFDQMDGRIIAKASGVQPDDHIWMLSTLAAGQEHVLRFRVRTGGSTTTLIATGDVLSTGLWTHVAATYDGATMRLWQNGLEVGQTAKTGAVDTDPTMGATIGNQPARDRPFDGRIDDVRLFDRALIQDEITRLAAFYRPFDVDQNGTVAAPDLTAFISAPSDLNNDGMIDAEDEACLGTYLATLDCGTGSETLCPPTPASGCIDTFGKSALQVKERAVGRERLTVKMTRGPGLLAADFGDPLAPGGTEYTFCLFDGADTLVAEATVDRAGLTCAGKECWKPLGSLGYQYKDKDLSADGVLTLRLKGGTVGRSQIQIRGKNNAPRGQVSLPGPIAPSLVGATSATMQILTNDGSGCFSSVLGTVTRSDPDFFKAKN